MNKIFQLKKTYEEKIYNEEMFEKHAKRVSHSADDLKVVNHFYDVLKNSNIELQKTDFEPIIFGNKYLEQEIVNNVFKDREKVRLEEIFTYLFTHNLNSIDNFLLDNYDEGKYYIYTQKIKLLNNFYGKHCIKNFAEIKLSKNCILMHELMHILSLKTYKSDEFLAKVAGFNNVCGAKIGRRYFFFELDKNNKINQYNSIISSLETREDKNLYSGFGTFDEALNEYILIKILNAETYFKNDYYSGTNFYQNQILAMKNNQNVKIFCPYNMNMDVLKFLEILLEKPNFLTARFNTERFLTNINNYKIDKDLKKYVEQVFNRAKIDVSTEKMPTSEIILRLLGLADEYTSETINVKQINKYFEVKSIIQACLISAIENKFALEKPNLASPKLIKSLIDASKLLIKSNNEKITALGERHFDEFLNYFKIKQNFEILSLIEPKPEKLECISNDMEKLNKLM